MVNNGLLPERSSSILRRLVGIFLRTEEFIIKKFLAGANKSLGKSFSTKIELEDITKEYLEKVKEFSKYENTQYEDYQKFLKSESEKSSVMKKMKHFPIYLYVFKI